MHGGGWNLVYGAMMMDVVACAASPYLVPMTSVTWP
jgi:hypothetical protein